MKVCEYLRPRSFLDLGPRSCTYETCFSQKPLGHFPPNFVCKLLGTSVQDFGIIQISNEICASVVYNSDSEIMNNSQLCRLCKSSKSLFICSSATSHGLPVANVT